MNIKTTNNIFRYFMPARWVSFRVISRRSVTFLKKGN